MQDIWESPGSSIPYWLTTTNSTRAPGNSCSPERLPNSTLPADEAPTSSAALPQGGPVVLVTGKENRFRRAVIVQKPDALVVRLDSGISTVSTGAPLRLYFHNSTGIYSFATRIVDQEDKILYLRHSSNIGHHQRRKYFRRTLRLPVFIKPIASAKAGPHESVLIDLGGGGASLRNPEGLLKRRDRFELCFVAGKADISLKARVLRVSRNGAVINTKFESLADAERDRIMSLLFVQTQRHIDLPAIRKKSMRGGGAILRKDSVAKSRSHGR